MARLRNATRTAITSAARRDPLGRAEATQRLLDEVRACEALIKDERDAALAAAQAAGFSFATLADRVGVTKGTVQGFIAHGRELSTSG